MTKRLINKESRMTPAQIERVEMVFDKLPADGSLISVADIRLALINDSAYNPEGLSKSEVRARVASNLITLGLDERAVKHSTRKGVMWRRDGGDFTLPETPDGQGDVRYPLDSMETKVLEALRVSSIPSTFDQIVDRILGVGSVTKPLDSELDRDECEDGVHEAISQLVSDKQIVESIVKGRKDGTYSEV